MNEIQVFLSQKDPAKNNEDQENDTAEIAYVEPYIEVATHAVADIIRLAEVLLE